MDIELHILLDDILKVITQLKAQTEELKDINRQIARDIEKIRK